MPNSERHDTVHVLEEAFNHAIAWIEQRSRMPVAPAAIAIPDTCLPEHRNGADDVIQAFLEMAQSGIINSAGPNYFGCVTEAQAVRELLIRQPHDGLEVVMTTGEVKSVS